MGLLVINLEYSRRFFLAGFMRTPKAVGKVAHCKASAAEEPPAIIFDLETGEFPGAWEWANLDSVKKKGRRRGEKEVGEGRTRRGDKERGSRGRKTYLSGNYRPVNESLMFD